MEDWLSKDIVWLTPATISFNLKERQRQQELDISDLIPSIREKGILSPLWVEEGTAKLLAGWRRLTTANFLKLEAVPCRIAKKGLTSGQLQLLEWEENAKRKDLTWQDNCLAVWNMYKFFSADGSDEDPIEKMARILSQTEPHTARQMEIGEHLEKGDLGVKNADSQQQAVTLLSRRRERAKGEALNRILEIENAGDGENLSGDPLDDFGREAAVDDGPDGTPNVGTPDASVLGVPVGVRGADSLPLARRPVAPPYAVHHADAHEFLAGYSGPRFNFLHCDLPYGVALNGQAAQSGFEGGGYDSSPEIYWQLCRSLLTHWDKFMFPNSHVMFWISMKFYNETIAFFEEHGPSSLKINPTPLIWHKTDNKGIISDHLRGPRNVYEAALIMSTGDRHIVKPVSNVYGCPTAKGTDAIHTNEKPDPMLRYFFQMFVDEHSRVLDPTCGSGSSIRTAESLGAEAALGLEFNLEFATRAQQKLVTTRNLAKMSSVVAGATADSILDSLKMEE